MRLIINGLFTALTFFNILKQKILKGNLNIIKYILPLVSVMGPLKIDK